MATEIDWTTITAAIRVLTHSESETVTLTATVTCEMHHAYPCCDWTELYRVTAADLLKIGPDRGGYGCLMIPFLRRICGAAARTGQIQYVADVEVFPGHIACVSSTKSALVLPVWNGQGQLLGVLDLDSDTPAAFTREDEDWLIPLLAEVLRGAA